jgi:hypothetical protein
MCPKGLRICHQSRSSGQRTNLGHLEYKVAGANLPALMLDKEYCASAADISTRNLLD